MSQSTKKLFWIARLWYSVRWAVLCRKHR